MEYLTPEYTAPSETIGSFHITIQISPEFPNYSISIYMYWGTSGWSSARDVRPTYFGCHMGETVYSDIDSINREFSRIRDEITRYETLKETWKSLSVESFWLTGDEAVV